MHIYFVNKKSCIRGPFDLSASHRQKIIQIGDVIIRDTTTGLSFLIVVSEKNKWNACKCVGYAEGNIVIEENSLLFSFDGVCHRFGNIKAMERLRDLFNISPISGFFDNAISILTYRCDLWDVNIFYQIHSLSPIEMQQRPSKKTIIEIGHNESTVYLFERYLDVNLYLLFKSLVHQNKKMRYVYKELREQYPKEFRQALKLFLKDHPNSTIYNEV